MDQFNRFWTSRGSLRAERISFGGLFNSGRWDLIPVGLFSWLFLDQWTNFGPALVHTIRRPAKRISHFGPVDHYFYLENISSFKPENGDRVEAAGLGCEMRNPNGLKAGPLVQVDHTYFVHTNP